MAASSFTEVAFTVHPQNTANMSRPCVIYQQIMFKQPSQVRRSFNAERESHHHLTRARALSLSLPIETPTFADHAHFVS
jgi:hypothetical protein